MHNRDRHKVRAGGGGVATCLSCYRPRFCLIGSSSIYKGNTGNPSTSQGLFVYNFSCRSIFFLHWPQAVLIWRGKGPESVKLRGCWESLVHSPKASGVFSFFYFRASHWMNRKQRTRGVDAIFEKYLLFKTIRKLTMRKYFVLCLFLAVENYYLHFFFK